VVGHEAGVVRELATLGPGRFVAELGILTGERVFATAVVTPEARRLREFAARNRLLYVWVDLDTDPGAGAVLAHHGLGPSDAPIVLMRGGEVLRNPSNSQLARAAGFGTGAVPRTTERAALAAAVRPWRNC
jgi:hypothetical protein